MAVLSDLGKKSTKIFGWLPRTPFGCETRLCWLRTKIESGIPALHTNPVYIVREQGNVMRLFFTCREKLITVGVVQLLYNCFVVVVLCK